MNDLPDVNVWVALSVPEHPDHARAGRYWQSGSSETIAFCRVTALGLVRVCAGRHTVGGQGLPLREAWRHYQSWREDQAVVLIEEPRGVEKCLENLVESGLVVRKTWTDAYLAAFAISAGLRLVTFDRDFECFSGLDLLRL